MTRPTISKKAFQAKPKDPDTSFHRSGQPLGLTVLAFWRWASSNLVSNAFRGNLAEFLVWHALDAEGDVRPTWDEVDLKTKSGIGVEVKSSAYLQDWGQDHHSKPTFNIAPSRAWDKERGHRAAEAHRHSMVYVFCLLHHKEPDTLDPMDVDQWTFYVVPTTVLNFRYSQQKTLALGKLNKLVSKSEAQKVQFGQLDAAVQWAAAFAGGTGYPEAALH